MSKEKQILQMLQDGYSQRRIASTLCVSRNTVAKVVKAASDYQLSKEALESMEEMEIRYRSAELPHRHRFSELFSPL